VIDHVAPPPATAEVLEPFEDLFRRHFSGLVRFAALLGADDPANLAQEAFLRLHSRQRRLRDEGAALPYLRRTVVNLHRNRLRHLRVVRREINRPVPASAPSAEDIVVTGLDGQNLHAALRELSPRLRTILVLRYWLDLSGPEIAKTLDVPLGTVKSQTSRALAALTEHLKEHS
jgi:RNA polymerase sigma-70 factor (sigma-E family)